MGKIDVKNIDLPLPRLADVSKGPNDEVDVFCIIEADRIRDAAKGAIESKALRRVVSLFKPVDPEDVTSVAIGKGNRGEAPIKPDVDDRLRLEFLNEPEGKSLIAFPGALNAFYEGKRGILARMRPRGS